jgi:hypothetical protein
VFCNLGDWIFFSHHWGSNSYWANFSKYSQLSILHIINLITWNVKLMKDKNWGCFPS